MKLTPEQEKRFGLVASETYHAIGYDAWGDRTPRVGEFVDVIDDQMFTGHGRHPLTEDERTLWAATPKATRTRIIRRVGP